MLQSTEARTRELFGLFARLKNRIREAREAASMLYDQEEEATWNLTPQEIEEVPEVRTWGERRRLYESIRKMKRIRQAIRRREFRYGPHLPWGRVLWVEKPSPRQAEAEAAA